MNAQEGHDCAPVFVLCELARGRLHEGRQVRHPIRHALGLPLRQHLTALHERRIEGQGAHVKGHVVSLGLVEGIGIADHPGSRDPEADRAVQREWAQLERAVEIGEVRWRRVEPESRRSVPAPGRPVTGSTYLCVELCSPLQVRCARWQRPNRKALPNSLAQRPRAG